MQIYKKRAKHRLTNAIVDDNGLNMKRRLLDDIFRLISVCFEYVSQASSTESSTALMEIN